MSLNDNRETAKRSRTGPYLTRRSALAGVAGLTAGLAGCGGGDGGDSGGDSGDDEPTDSPSPTESPTPTVTPGVIEPDPVVHYRLDESADASTAVDSVGGYEATLEAGVTPGENGQVDTAYLFTGEGAVVDEAGDEYINGQSALTITVWVKANEIPNDRGIIETGVRGTGRDEFTTLRYDESGYSSGESSLIKAGIRTGPAPGETETPTSTALEALPGSGNNFETAGDTQTTDWQHLVLTWEAGDIPRVYIDGSEAEYAAEAAPTDDNAVTKGAKHFLIGASGRDPGLMWKGKIDDVRVYHERLGDDQIAALAGM